MNSDSVITLLCNFATSQLLSKQIFRLIFTQISVCFILYCRIKAQETAKRKHQNHIISSSDNGKHLSLQKGSLTFAI